jgi:exodeoxyribonuclease V alpha subunit
MTVDLGDVRLARTADGLLGVFNAAGVLDPADAHVAARIGRLGGETDEEVLLAVALAVRAVRLGSVCVDLASVSHTVLGEGDELVDVSALPWPDPARWLAACAASPVVADGPDAPSGRPLRIVDGLLYLARYWGEEEVVRRSLTERAAAAPPAADIPRLRVGLERHFSAPGSERQRLAAAVSVLRRVTVLAGGPGTGKTTTVARLLALLHDQPGPPPRVALAAPTGKAAARLQEAVAAELPAELRSRTPEAATLHRLLGWRPGGRFRYGATQRLPFDVVVVDETSMVSLTLMARLLEAVRPDARIVLVGDPDQLASVEAGAVLGDLARAPGQPEAALDAALEAAGIPGGLVGGSVINGVVTLRHVWRFGGAIAEFSRAVQAGDADAAAALLRGGHSDLEFVDPDDVTGVRTDVVAAGRPRNAARRRRHRARGPGTPPGAVRPPQGAVRGHALERGDRAVAAGCPPRCASGPVVPRAAGARHGQRLRRGPVQRRHRRGGRAAGGPAGRVRPRRGAHPAPAGPAVGGGHRARDDRAPRAGQPVPAGHGGAAARRVAAAHPGAALHGDHPGRRVRPGGRHGGGGPRGGRAPGQPGERAAAPASERPPGWVAPTGAARRSWCRVRC